MMLRESDSNVGHFITSPCGHVFHSRRRLLKLFAVWSKSHSDKPLRQPAPAEPSPSKNTILVPSGEKLGTCITELPRPLNEPVTLVTVLVLELICHTL